MPVIVLDRVGTKECVADGVSGFIYNFDNLDELTDKILFFLWQQGKNSGVWQSCKRKRKAVLLG